jgi:hypothetical protein
MNGAQPTAIRSCWRRSCHQSHSRCLLLQTLAVQRRTQAGGRDHPRAFSIVTLRRQAPGSHFGQADDPGSLPLSLSACHSFPPCHDGSIKQIFTATLRHLILHVARCSACYPQGFSLHVLMAAVHFLLLQYYSKLKLICVSVLCRGHGSKPCRLLL